MKQADPPFPTQPGEGGLANALEKNKEAAEAVQHVADELGVIHEVLRSEIAEIAASGDADSAIERTHTLEAKLHDTVEKMDEVNQALAAQQESLAHLGKSGDPMDGDLAALGGLPADPPAT